MRRRAHAANPAQDYILNCMGCHGTEAQGIPGKVPPLANALSRFMRSPEGRNYVLRVPGAANSALSDQQLAAVLNWLAGHTNPGVRNPTRPVYEHRSRRGPSPTVTFGARHPQRSGPQSGNDRTQPTAPVLIRKTFMLLALAAAAAFTQSPTPADLVLTDGRIYTEDAVHSTASALAVQGGKIVFVGSTADAKKWVGPATRVEALGWPSGTAGAGSTATCTR